MARNTKYLCNLKKNLPQTKRKQKKKQTEVLNIDKWTYHISSAITSNKMQA